MYFLTLERSWNYWPWNNDLGICEAENISGSEDEDEDEAGGSQARASKKKEKKRQEREAQRQVTNNLYGH